MAENRAAKRPPAAHGAREGRNLWPGRGVFPAGLVARTRRVVRGEFRSCSSGKRDAAFILVGTTMEGE